MLESVQGVEGGLKFDATTGRLVPASSIIQEFDSGKSFSFTIKSHSAKQSDATIKHALSTSSTSCIDSEAINVKMEEEYLSIPYPLEREYKPRPLIIENYDESRLAALDTGPSWPASLLTVPWATSPNAPKDSFLSRGHNRWELCDASVKIEASESHLVSGCSSSVVPIDETKNLFKGNTVINLDDGFTEHNQPTSSGMTDSTNESALMNSSSSSSRSFDEKSPTKAETSCGDSGSKITVKATYKEDMIRFKFEPSSGCSELYEQVSKRFGLETGQFQLKYLDDEKEWVMLVNDSDLHECLEILEFVGTRTVKFMVRDVSSPTTNSGTNNYLLAGGRNIYP